MVQKLSLGQNSVSEGKTRVLCLPHVRESLTSVFLSYSIRGSFYKSHVWFSSNGYVSWFIHER
jgi:hypothetical protein